MDRIMYRCTCICSVGVQYYPKGYKKEWVKTAFRIWIRSDPSFFVNNLEKARI
jgi:hypothetical protein